MLPTLLYGAENWLLDQPCILKLGKFQAEIGRRILHLSKFHSRLSILLALRWPSMRARILNIKLSYFHHLLTSDNDSLGTRTFNTLASIDVYKLGLTQQCFFLDSEVGSGAVAELLSNPDSATFHLISRPKLTSSSLIGKLLLRWLLLVLLRLQLSIPTGCGCGRRSEIMVHTGHQFYKNFINCSPLYPF